MALSHTTINYVSRRREEAIHASWNLDLVESAFAEAATDSSRWQNAMETAAGTTGAVGAALFPIRGRLPNVPHSRSMAASLDAYVRDEWIHRDERYNSLPIFVRKGVTTDLDFTNRDEIARHPYYQEFLGPFRLRWYAGVKVASGDDLWCLSIQRSIEQGPFSVREQQRLAQLSKQLSSAAALARALGFARAEAALDAFEVSGSAVALLDRFGQVLRVNANAERLLASDPHIAQRRITSFDREATAALDGALHALLWRRSSVMMAPIILPRREKRPLLAYPLRLPAVSVDALAPCQAVVVFVDPDTRETPPAVRLQAAFGLTTAEARLASRLAAGESLSAAADALAISYETARNQLKSVFAKTDTRRQGELVAIVNRVARPIGRLQST